MKIVVGAVPGAGKTTILKCVKRKLPKVKVVNVGDLIFKIVKKKFKIKDRDEMRKKLKVNEQRFVQEHAYKQIARMKNKIVLIDTHLSIKTLNGFFPGMSDEIVKMLRPDAIVVLEFDADDILERRRKDLKRKRDIESKKEIEEHQKFNRIFASTVAAVAGCPVEIINMRFKERKKFEHALKASEEIIRVIGRLE